MQTAEREVRPIAGTLLLINCHWTLFHMQSMNVCMHGPTVKIHSGLWLLHQAILSMFLREGVVQIENILSLRRPILKSNLSKFPVFSLDRQVRAVAQRFFMNKFLKEC